MVPTSNSSNIHISTGRIWRFSVLAVLQTRFITPTLHLIRKDRCRVITEDIEGHPGQEAEFPACNTSISVIPSLFAYRHPNPFMYKLYTSFIVAAAVSYYIQMWDRNKIDSVFLDISRCIFLKESSSWFTFHRSLLLWIQPACNQTIGHYPNPGWLSSPSYAL